MNKIISFLFLLVKFGFVFASCKVSDIPVQPNFDISKYVGVTWYEQSWLPEPDHSPETLSQDYQHTYYLQPDGATITAFVNGRDPPDLTKCFFYRTTYVTTEVPGKWQRKYARAERSSDFWIVSTDYASYSVVYGCKEENYIGECVKPSVWIWSRRPAPLPPATISVIEDILDTLCVNKSAFIATDQTNECSENKECRIYSIDNRKQQDFQIHKYAGKWFEVEWLPQAYIPADQLYQDYQHIYDLNSDGTILTGFIRGRDPADLSKCFYNVGQLLTTSQPGKFQYRRKINATHVFTTDYWVIGTDYDTYAVIYGCRNLDSTGLCTYADSWIWSRFPEIPANKKGIVEGIKGSLCVNTTMYLSTEQHNECSKERDCTVTSILQRTVQDLDISKFGGLWYKYAYLSITSIGALTDCVVEFSPVVSDEQTFTAEIRARYQENGYSCGNKELVIHQSDTPGKLRSTRKTKTGIEQTETFIMALNYTSFYVEYFCYGQSAQSKCNKPSASIWTRSTSLTPETFAEARRIIISLCLDYDKFVEVEHSNECPSSKGSQVTSGFLLMLSIIILMLE